nr:proline-rich receptor-like protein kinase PERK2 [Aegilops tauschii subsp. strangulata]
MPRPGPPPPRSGSGRPRRPDTVAGATAPPPRRTPSPTSTPSPDLVAPPHVVPVLLPDPRCPVPYEPPVSSAVRPLPSSLIRIAIARLCLDAAEPGPAPDEPVTPPSPRLRHRWPTAAPLPAATLLQLAYRRPDRALPAEPTSRGRAAWLRCVHAACTRALDV